MLNLLLFLLAASAQHPPGGASGWRSAALTAAGLDRAENELAVVGALVSLPSSNYSLTITPSAVADGAFITVSYNSSTPTWGDWLAVYAPASANITATVPVKYAWVDDDAYLATGRGTRRIQLISMRSPDFSVHYMSGGLSHGGVSRASATVLYAGDALAPQRPRLGVENSTHLRVTWSSGRSPATAAPALQWGLDGAAFPHAPPVASSALAREQLCGPPANGTGYFDLGWVHSALIDLTLPAPPRPAAVFYRLRDSASAWSSATRARVPAASGQPPTLPYTLLAFDDLGRGSADDAVTWSEYGRSSLNTSLWLAAQADADVAAAVWIVGDISYATGYLAVWEWWLHMASPWIARLPTLFGVGNHESGALQSSSTAGPAPANHYSFFHSNDAGGECGIVTTALLPLPSTGARSAAASADAPFWALATGPFLLITLSSEHALSPGSSQLQWLEATLALANRTLTPFILLGCHRPMLIDSTYASDGRANGSPDTADTPVAAALQAHVEPLTMRYKVTLALYGHNHAVQRLTPAYRNASVQHSTLITHSSGVGTSALFFAPPATLHMVIGTGGAGFTKNCAACNASAPLPPPSFSERVFYAWGALRITARNDSTLELDWVETGSGSVLDSVTLVQDLGRAWADEGGGAGEGSRVWVSPGLLLGAGVGALGALGAVVLVGACLRRWRGGQQALSQGAQGAAPRKRSDYTILPSATE